MTIINYYDQPAPIDWDAVQALIGAAGTEAIIPDISDPSTIFQDSAASFPSAFGAPVGLVLDKSKGLAFTPEQFTNIDFSQWSGGNPVGWTVQGNDATRTITQDPSGGARMTWSGGGNLLRLWQPIADTRLRWVEVDIIVNSGYVKFSGTTGGDLPNGTIQLNASGTYRIYTPRGVGGFGLKAQGTDGDVIIKRFSVREILGNHLSQATAAARMIYGRFPKTGWRNIIAPSSEILSGTWANVGLVTLSDDTKIIATDATLQQHRLDKTMTLGMGATWSAGVSEAGYRYLVFRFTNTMTVFDLQEGIVVSNANPDAGIEVDPDNPDRYIVWATSGQSGSQVLRVNTSPTPDTGAFIGDNVSGTNIFWQQVEQGPRTPYQKVVNTYDVTEAGVPDVYYLRPDLTDDALTATLPQAINGDIVIAGTNGSIIEPISYAPGSTFSLGPTTYTGGTPGILRALGDIVGMTLLDRTLSQVERDQLIAYYKDKGAKGLLVPGPELVVNPNDPDTYVFNPGGSGSLINEDGWLKMTRGAATTLAAYSLPFGTYRMNTLIKPGTANINVRAGTSSGSTVYFNQTFTAETNLDVVIAGTTLTSPVVWSFQISGADEGSTVFFKDFSVKELRPQEDWA